MKKLLKRKLNRMQDYDYSQNGAYFVTVCTKDRHEIFGAVTFVGDATLGVPPVELTDIPSVELARVPPAESTGVPYVKLSEYGETVKMFIENIPNANPSVFVPKYVIMPNHIHLILVIELENIRTPKKNIHGTPKAASPTKALIPKIINVLKGLSSKKTGFSLWQRSYHDHIIRSEADYNRIEKYIENNPAHWEENYFNSTSWMPPFSPYYAARRP